jgi:hypothetical protein
VAPKRWSVAARAATEQATLLRKGGHPTTGSGSARASSGMISGHGDIAAVCWLASCSARHLMLSKSLRIIGKSPNSEQDEGQQRHACERQS